MRERIYLTCEAIERGDYLGTVMKEDGTILGSHISSSTQWLRHDLMRKIDTEQYEIIDMIEDDVRKILDETNSKT